MIEKLCLYVGVLLSLASVAHAQQFPGSVGRPGTFPGTNRPGTFPGAPTPQQPGQPGRPGIDDSTKQIYGPRTARYFLEADVFNNRKTLYITDTTLTGVHNWTFVQRSQNRLQDLGSLGTALRPVFFEPPTQLGAQLGYYVYAPYGYQADQVRYYDTKSPLSEMYVVLGNRNQNILNFNFSQNITPRWNAGFNAQRFTAQRQFGFPIPIRSQSDRLLAQNWAFLAHTNYRSKNDKYTLLLHFRHLNHEVPDQGGVVPGVTRQGGDTTIYNYEGNAKLSGAGTRELHNDWRIYQQYVLDQGFQVYHRLDYQRHINGFTDNQPGLNQAFSNFYPGTPTDSTQLRQDVRYRLLENNVGLKGIFRGQYNYRAYFRQRIYGLNNRHNAFVIQGDSLVNGFNTVVSRGFENFVGAWAGYYFPDSLTRVTAEVEHLLGRDLRVQGQLEMRFLTAGYSSILASPTLIQNRYAGSLFNWNNDFRLRGTQHLYGRLTLRLRGLSLQPGIDYYLLTNYVYFDQRARPRQFTGAFSVLRTGLGYTFRTGRFETAGQAYYTVVSRPDLLRQPTLFWNGRVQYEFIYAKVLTIQAGLELHYKSAYFADAYMPVTQQFHLQDAQRVEGYLMADAFANFRINRVRLFVKMSHLNQGVFAPGYFVAPGFLQMRRGFGFGVDWYLFD